jgi:hypothetical protein
VALLCAMCMTSTIHLQACSAFDGTSASCISRASLASRYSWVLGSLWLCSSCCCLRNAMGNCDNHCVTRMSTACAKGMGMLCRLWRRKRCTLNWMVLILSSQGLSNS